MGSKESARLLLYWAPRLLAFLFALFIGLFALDVFSEVSGFWMTAAALLLHLIPTFVILLLLAAAWKWEWVGAVGFTTLGILYLAAGWGSLHWSAWAAISGPLLLIGFMFLMGWVYRAGLRVTP